MRVLLLAGTVLWSWPSFALQPLEAFVRSSLQKNVDVMEATAVRDQQRAQSDVALGHVLPGLLARLSYTRNQYESTATLGGCSTCTPPTQGVTYTLVPRAQWDGSAVLNVPLVDVSGWLRAKAADTNEEAANHQLISTRLGVQGTVVADYYTLVAFMALVTASQQAVDVSKENLKLAETRYEAGVGQALDVDRARADVEQRTQELANARLQVALSAQALDTSSGIKPDAREAVQLGDDLHEEQPVETFEADLEKLPSVVAAIESTRAADQQATAQRFTLLPTINGNFAERGTNAPGFGQQWAWQALIAANWTLDWSTKGNIDFADAAADAARAREQRSRLFARDAIRRQWETVSANIARSRSARAGQAAATRAMQQARDRYQAGTITQLDLLQAQRDSFVADVTRIQADAELVNARVQLRIAAGQAFLKEGM